MSVRALTLVTFLLASGALAQSEEEEVEVFPSDPRMIEANALISDKSGYERAVELYESVLADDPHHRNARQWAARVEAWSGHYDASLAHFDELIDRADPPPEAEIERAEVLSWAGRYEEAQRAFLAILATDPEQVRARLGLARSYRWSQSPELARENYEQALALAADADVARELAALESSHRWSHNSDAAYFEDSDGFRTVRGSALMRFDFSFGKGIFARVGHIRARSGDGFFAEPNMRRRDAAVDVMLGGELLFAEKFRARLEAGARIWDHAGTFGMLRGELEYNVDPQGSVGLELAYSDALDWTQSLQAVDAGIGATNLRGWVWRGWSPRIESYSHVEGTFLGAPSVSVPDATCNASSVPPPAFTCGQIEGGKNERVGVGTSVSYRLLEEHDLRATLAVDYQHYANGSVYYYSPQHDFGAAAGLAGSQPVFAGLSFEADASLGGGVTEDTSGFSSGLLYRVAGGAVYDYDGWAFSTHAFISQSLRESAYTAWGIGLNFATGF